MKLHKALLYLRPLTTGNHYYQGEGRNIFQNKGSARRTKSGGKLYGPRRPEWGITEAGNKYDLIFPVPSSLNITSDTLEARGQGSLKLTWYMRFCRERYLSENREGVKVVLGLRAEMKELM